MMAKLWAPYVCRFGHFIRRVPSAHTAGRARGVFRRWVGAFLPPGPIFVMIAKLRASYVCRFGHSVVEARLRILMAELRGVPLR